MTPSQMNKLGEKLRVAEELTDDLLGPLQELRAAFHAPMLRAQAIVRDSLAIETTARLKTVNSIIEKLKRERTRLSRMQDMAGLRIVVGPWRAEQDVVVSKLVGVFDREHTEIDDRRVRPSYGYRAVHIITRVDGHLVEVQVRTLLQDLWAQTMERLGDRLGRAIRHGAEPRSGGDLVRHLQHISEQIAKLEEVHQAKVVIDDEMKAILEGQRGTLSPDQQSKVADLQRRLESNCDTLPVLAKEIHEHLGDILREVHELGHE